MAKKPTAPKGLATAGKKLWREVVDTYELRVDELQVLQAACEEADLIAVLREGLDGQDLIVTGSMGQDVIHPLIPELRQHRNTLSGLLAKLKLPDEPGGERPNQQRDAVNSRWNKAYGN